MGEKVWFYESHGKRLGPFDEEEIRELIQSGKITYGTLVWKQGMKEWKLIEDTELIKYLSEVSPPPLKGQSVNNTVVWFLAFAPLIGTILEYTIAEMKYGSDLLAQVAVKNGQFWYVTLLLNIGLAYLDDIILKRAGHDTSKFGGWAIIVPVYLYKRAKAVGHNLAYFIVWWVTFFLSLYF